MTTPPVITITDELLTDIQREFDRNGPCPHDNWNLIGAGNWLHCDDCWQNVAIELLESAKSAAEKHANLSLSLGALLQHVRELKADAERLDSLDKLCEAYGFEGVHEGSRWVIDGPFRNVRDAIDSLPDDASRSSATR